MVHTKLYMGYKLIAVLSAILLVLSQLLWYIPVNGLTAAELATYKGKYDYKADHDIHNPKSANYNSIVTTEYKEGVLQNCYQSFVGWGMTPQGASGVIANIMCESGGDPAICWGYVTHGITKNYTWADYAKGAVFPNDIPDCPSGCGSHEKGEKIDVGFGLIEFTAKDVVFAVWDKAAELGVQWTDLGAQLEYMKTMIGPKGTGSAWNENDIGNYPNNNSYSRQKSQGLCVEKLYDPSYTAGQCADAYCRTFEVPGRIAEAANDRAQMATEVYEKYKNLSPIDSTSLVGTSDPSKTSTGSIIDLGGLVDEWDLVGMPKKSGLAENAIIPSLPNFSDLSSSEQYSIGMVRNQMKESSAFNAWNTARQVVVFVGLMLMTYTVLLALAMVFDSVNVFFDFSLVRFLTFGLLNYHSDLSDVDAATIEKGKMISKKRMIVLLVVLLGVSLLFIAGGVFSGVLRAVYWLVDLFGGNLG